jgi:RNA-binding protein
MALTGKQSHHLRALGHHLNPVVHIGKEGVTEALAKAIDQALTDHELVKVKLNPETPHDRYEAAEALAESLKAEVAQVIGRTLLLYRRHPSLPKINLPKA